MFFLWVLLITGSKCFTLDDLVEDTSWVHINDTRITGYSLQNKLTKFKEALGNSIGLRTGDSDVEEGPVDCFGFNWFLQQFFRWLFTPQHLETIGVKFFLATRENRSRTEWMQGSDSFGYQPFQSRRGVVVIVHGFMSNSNMFWVKDMTNALLDKSDKNVIIVDWGGGSLSWKYWQAVANTRIVGKQLSKLLQRLLLQGLTRSQVHCIGHSLGAHICSFAANQLGVFGRITGLDPAQPCFTGGGLNVSDAIHVDVIHTNTGLLGRMEKLGSQDFYPNGGVMQPGCVLRDSVLLSMFPITRNKLQTAICSHGRSYEYFIDSLRSETCQFWGRQWDFSDVGALKVMKKPCTLLTCVPMGMESNKFPGKGPYYVPTLPKTPFCFPDAETPRVMKAWNRILQKFQKKLQTLKSKFIF